MKNSKVNHSKHESQLSLFPNPEGSSHAETNQLAPVAEAPELISMSELDVAIARFEGNPEMSQAEYKRWIKLLINNSLKTM